MNAKELECRLRDTPITENKLPYLIYIMGLILIEIT